MKKLILMGIIVLLTGCSTATQESFQESMANELKQQAEASVMAPANRKHFYSYYKEPNVGRRSNGETFNVFVKEGVEFIMNLNVSYILDKNYYKKSIQVKNDIQSENLLFTIAGKYKNYLGETYDYECLVYQTNTSYYVILVTEYMTFYTTGNLVQMMRIAPTMLSIAQSVNIDADKVVTAYFSQEVIENKKERLQLYEVMIPENGRIEEMMPGGTTVVDGNGSTSGTEFSNDSYGEEDSTKNTGGNNDQSTDTNVEDDLAGGDDGY